MVSREKIQFLVVGLQNRLSRIGSRIRLRELRAKFHSSFTTLGLLPRIFASIKRMARPGRVGTIFREALFGAALLLGFALAARAQEPSTTEGKQTDSPTQTQAGVTSADQKKTPESPTPADSLPPPNHRFWDRENDLLFAGVGAGRALDYASTLNLRRRGIDEVFLTNSIVDNHPLFAGIEASATAASIGVSYIFHRTGHHRLERWTSGIHFGVAVVGAARNYALKTPHH